MKVLPGGSRHLEALPGVCRAAVQQFCPGYAVLAWNADLPVAVDHKLGATVLKGWRRGGGGYSASSSVNVAAARAAGPPEVKGCCQEEEYASRLGLATARKGNRSFTWRGPTLGKSSLRAALL